MLTEDMFRAAAYALGGLCIGGYLFGKGFVLWVHWRRVANTPISAVRSIAMGPVELEGRVEPADKSFMVPCMQKKCVAYELSIEETGKFGNTLLHEEKRAEFYLKDKTGRVLIDPKNAELFLTHTQFNAVYDSFAKVPRRIRSFCAKRKIDLKKSLRWKSVEFDEECLEVGGKVHVGGAIACDNPYVAEGTGQKNTDDVLIRGSREYVISDCHEEEALKGLSQWTIKLLVFGGILIIVSVAVLSTVLDSFFW